MHSKISGSSANEGTQIFLWHIASFFRSIEVARDHECGYYFAALTGIYSQKIFAGFGFQLMRKISYDDAIDLKGNLIVNDHREHTHVETVYLKLGAVAWKS